MNPHQQPAPTCFRHPDRVTGLGCTRCGRPACPECLTPAAVGQQCVECVRQGRNETRQVRNVGGAVASNHPQPYVTYGLIALNLIVFAITAVQARTAMDMNSRNSELFYDWVLVPVAVGEGEWWRVLGSGFLHYGLIHVAVNMFALYVLGPYAEIALGRGRFVAVYFASLLGGSAAITALSEPLSASAGASGAIFGLFGAVAVIMLRTKQNMTQILVLLVINLIITFSVPNISIWAHLGGLLAGTVATAGILYLPRWLHAGTPKAAALIGWGAVAAVVVIALAVTVFGAPSLPTVVNTLFNV
ncbi:rhomboid family intramembrane serine protease [Nocardia huaxiensis]|uniref:Rhomboid family intramembrane serine protease n=1 Tax=Nocardia huaxiensis TaxID=2755382 RepID=A0A7D6VAW0_9NOCA|nr:rhomboid family intramembrane serine protease [Nocardia huaxiensis]QLY31074.1 rhomboid family intramembrane serine protease [Nocardia huaxiensis]UFS94600.1 rhomboid family intramembrane serine protease [Nocardia huaxiensis]